jgi:uracil-DNA glycosylase
MLSQISKLNSMKIKKSIGKNDRSKLQSKTSAADYLPKNHKASLDQLKKAATKCQGCSLYLPATQTVFGEGSAGAKILFVGEQPGDKEDLQGKPFVGPAGQLLDRALAAAGIDRKRTYLTNAVKHFKFEERGKRRLHKKPNRSEIDACRPWLEAEIAKIQPDIIVCLGATAIRSLFNKTFSVKDYRGQFLKSALADRILITVHPSSILRLIESEERHAAFSLFVEDLKKIVK